MAGVSSLERVVVLGMSGAGKSTLARRLAQTLGARHIELNALFWGPDWEPRPPAEFRRDVEAAVQARRWVVDGNYGSVRDMVWPRATTIVWLNLSFACIFWRVLRRTLRRVSTAEVLWAGNRESWRRTLFTRESILWWVLTMYHRRRRQYAALRQAATAGPVWIELRTPRAVREWLRQVDGHGAGAEVRQA